MNVKSYVMSIFDFKHLLCCWRVKKYIFTTILYIQDKIFLEGNESDFNRII